MTEQTFPIVDGAFTVPERTTEHGDFASLDIGINWYGDVVLYRVNESEPDDTMSVHAADIPAFVASLDALTGGGYRRKVAKEAARAAKQLEDLWQEDFEEFGSTHASAKVEAAEKIVAAIRALAEKGE